MEKAYSSRTQFKAEVSFRTDKGLMRSVNEDAFAFSFSPTNTNWLRDQHKTSISHPNGIVLLVADGLGGAVQGDMAANTAIESIQRNFGVLYNDNIPSSVGRIQDFLTKLLYLAHHEIVELVRKHPEYSQMGTTITIVWIIDLKMHIVWSGDSRCYIYNPNTSLKLVTNDHSLVWSLVVEGLLTPEEARTHPQNNVITQCLGVQSDPPKPEFCTLEIKRDDCILICTDGLSSMVSHEDITNIITKNRFYPNRCVQKLVDAAKLGGGKDNITIGFLKFY